MASNNVMGVSSFSSSQAHDQIYDVFLSFRGVDTRRSFTAHLYKALRDADFNTFLDDEEIETGEPLKPELESAIQSSRASIIVLSKNYASSTWCLDELVLILEQKSKFNQIVIPVFYDVEPTDVRKQKNRFREAMSKHRKRMKAEKDAQIRSQLAQKIESWKRALREVSELKGEDAKGRKETDVIDEVITHLNGKLGVRLKFTLPLLVGMERDIQFISSWLTDESCHTADILPVVGMCGIGKTPLAKYIFNLHFGNFHKSIFIEGISKQCDPKSDGSLDLEKLLALQKQLYKEITGKTPSQINESNASYTSKIEDALARKKVFIVLDDIGSLDQLNALLGKRGLLPGSKIIITTKDASVTERCALFDMKDQPKHTPVLVKGLSDTESLEFLCLHAFKNNMPEEGYQELSEKLVKYCGGHPWALQVWGRHLRNRKVEYWEDTIKVLKKEPHSVINKALEMSFNSLQSNNDKNLFKHIACFFVGDDKDTTETILEIRDINTRAGIENLTDKCLLSTGENNKLEMHSLFQVMGRYLVCKENRKTPGKPNRLWCHESLEVLKKEKDKGNIAGLSLDMKMLDKEKLSELKTDLLSKMCDLMLLQLNNVKLSGSYQDFPKKLIWLCLQWCPFKSIPSGLPMENLVALNLSYSSIESFDIPHGRNPQPPESDESCAKDKRLLGSLKILDLSFCEHLQRVGGFLTLPALERLTVSNCISLIKVCDSVEQCVELVHIDLSKCKKLKMNLTFFGNLKKVETVLFDGSGCWRDDPMPESLTDPKDDGKSRVFSTICVTY